MLQCNNTRFKAARSTYRDLPTVYLMHVYESLSFHAKILYRSQRRIQ